MNNLVINNFNRRKNGALALVESIRKFSSMKFKSWLLNKNYFLKYNFFFLITWCDHNDVFFLRNETPIAIEFAVLTAFILIFRSCYTFELHRIVDAKGVREHRLTDRKSFVAPLAAPSSAAVALGKKQFQMVSEKREVLTISLMGIELREKKKNYSTSVDDHSKRCVVAKRASKIA